MAWWSALIDTTVSGISWLTRSSGDIATAYTVIRGIVGMEDDEALADGENLIPKLRRAIETNEKAMRAAAKKLMKLSADVEYGERLGDQRSALMELTGIFPDPTLVADGLAPADMNKDINKLLALYDFPTTTGEGEYTVDIGQSIAAAMCSRGEPISMLLPTETAKLLASPHITIGPDPDGFLIKGRHIWYQVPTCGTKVERNAWYSHVLLEGFMTIKSEAAWKAKKLALATPSTLSQLESNLDAPRSAVTVSAQWSSAIGHGPIMANAVKKMPPGYALVGNHSSNGITYNYSFQTATTIGPAAVLQAFEANIKAELGKDSFNMPITKIESQQTLLM